MQLLLEGAGGGEFGLQPRGVGGKVVALRPECGAGAAEMVHLALERRGVARRVAQQTVSGALTTRL